MRELIDKGDGIFVIHMADHDSRNAIDKTFVNELDKFSRHVQKNLSVKVVILQGTKDIFSSGGSAALIDALREYYQENVEHEYLKRIRTVLDIPVPVISAMEGGAVGGGLTLALYTDIIIAARESRYGFSFMNMGFTPGMGTTALALERFGYSIGMELMTTGDSRKGADLERTPAFNYVVPKDRVLPKALELAQAISEKPRVALELCKRCTSLRMKRQIEETSLVEALMHKISFNQPEIREFIRSNFAG